MLPAPRGAMERLPDRSRGAHANRVGRAVVEVGREAAHAVEAVEPAGESVRVVGKEREDPGPAGLVARHERGLVRPPRPAKRGGEQGGVAP